MGKKGKKRRRRPYSIDLSVSESAPTGSIDTTPKTDISKSWKLNKQEYTNVSNYETTSGELPEEDYFDEEVKSEREFIGKTGKTLFDTVFYLLSGVRHKSFGFLLLLGFCITHGVPYYKNNLTNWDDTLRAIVSFLVWTVVLAVIITLQKRKIENKDVKKQR